MKLLLKTNYFLKESLCDSPSNVTSYVSFRSIFKKFQVHHMKLNRYLILEQEKQLSG